MMIKRLTAKDCRWDMVPRSKYGYHIPKGAYKYVSAPNGVLQKYGTVQENHKISGYLLSTEDKSKGDKIIEKALHAYQEEDNEDTD